MVNTRTYKLLLQKESINLEFKEAKNELPTNLFETICAMLNRDGGDVFLGLTDKGKLIGVDDKACDKMINNIVNLSNNPQKIDPPFILHPLKHHIGDKIIIHIQIPASSQVHKTSNTVFDRSNDGDFKITQPNRIAELFNRKRNYYTENIIYPYLKFENFNEEIFIKARNLIKSTKAEHPWLALSNQQLLEVAGLWKKDFQTGEQGYTLAAALLFGKTETIQQIVPHYKTDAIVRVKDLNRYDDRHYVQTNLIDAYDDLMNFVAKHLPDKFYLQGDQRISLRSQIFREVIANILVHREFTNAQPSLLVIKRNRIELENANNPHGSGKIDPTNFSPFAKNPTIAKFFIQLGRVDELGSGILNTTRLIKEYSGSHVKPSFSEGSVFKTIIPIPHLELNDKNEIIVVKKNGAANSQNGAVNFKNDVANSESNDINSENIDNKGVQSELILKNDVANSENGVANSEIQKIIHNYFENETKKLKNTLTKLLYIIKNHTGLKGTEYGVILNLSDRTVDRYLKLLREANLIEFKGTSTKTGGYFLTKKIKYKIK